MNKAELIQAVSEKTKASKKETGEVLNAVISEITAAIAKGEKVQLVGFGTFERKNRNARVGRDPRNKKVIKIPASAVPVFKAGKSFKDALN